MQRLALIGSTAINRTEGERIAYRRSAGAYFGIGLAGGGAVGAAVLVALNVFAPGQARSSMQVPTAVAALAHWLPDTAASRTPASRVAKAQPVVAHVPQPAAPVAFDMVIDRSTRASAPFGLRLVGSEHAGMQVILHDVPSTASLSLGERRDATTWALKVADLENLHLTLNDGTPDAFNVRIEVSAPEGIATMSSVMRVRLVGTPVAERTASAPAEAAPVVPAAPIVAVASPEIPVQQRVAAPSREDAVKTRERVVARVTVPSSAPAAQVAEPRHWPEGASGLGAIARESDRQVWWKLPAPTWSPFMDLAGR